MHYFAPRSDPDGALKEYLEQKNALHAGHKPRPDPGEVTIKSLANSYLNHKKARLDAGGPSPHTWRNYKQAAEFLVSHPGKSRVVSNLGPDDFTTLRTAMTKKKWGPVRIRDFVQRIRGVFKHGTEVGLLSRTVLFGPGFAPPNRKTLRLARAEKGPKMFEAAELRALIDGATRPGSTAATRRSGLWCSARTRPGCESRDRSPLPFSA